jgi:Putative auto-transporter adhesin, head GIN domain
MRTIFIATALLTATGAQAQTIDRTIDIGAFNAVAVAGSTDADISVGPAQSIVLRGPKAVVDNLEVVLKDGALLIKQKKSSWGVSSKENAKAIITTPTLNKVAVSGSGNMLVSGVKTADFGIAVSGSGDVKASGSCTGLKSSISGSGDVDASALKCSTATVSVAGSGDSKAFASKDVTISIAGSGDVKIFGAPAGSCSINIAGSGDVALPGSKVRCVQKIAGSGEVTY